MRTNRELGRGPVTVLFCIALASLTLQLALVNVSAAEQEERDKTGPVEPPNSSADIRSTDHFVSHTSTVPANAGQHVKLFVRESVLRDRFNQASDDDTQFVLMISGST